MPDDITQKRAVMNYPSNSNKEREQTPAVPPKKVEKIIQGEAVQRKRPLGRRLAETFTGDDMRTAGSYVLFEVLAPALKTMISDAVSQGIERMLFGEARPRGGGIRTNYTSYNRMYSQSPTRREEPARTISHRARAAHDFGEVILNSRGEAEDVLDRLGTLVDQYDVATVADLYELVGITGSFTDAKWGWSDLRGSDIRRVRDGYLLVLPRTMPID